MLRTLPLFVISLCVAFSAHAGNHKDKHQGQHGKQEAAAHHQDAPLINSEEIRRILLGQREAIGPVKALPPGMQKRLAKGKPLPPGIAKRFSPNVLSQLPRYPGYDWEMAGTDVVLVETATRVIADVLYGVLQ
ncbi:anti-virulence regulator CigR family protein [Atopomonas hussainii]|uniref:anti-virulence regulator CigR family protein n=1 Tax=Atopomonas hussainii TaxID=1429083 RepID=UPI0009003C41|nr:anti-virulence regulator CigR family protein [Atopomonas hussainii]